MIERQFSGTLVVLQNEIGAYIPHARKMQQFLAYETVQRVDILDDDMEYKVMIAGERPAGDHLARPLHERYEFFRRAVSVAAQANLNENLDLQAELASVEQRYETPDYACLSQTIKPACAGGGRETDAGGQFAYRFAAILLKDG